MRILSASILLVLPAVAPAATLTVGPSGMYQTIRGAVRAAQAGDRIEVDAGTYDEDEVQVSVDLEIVGLGGSAGTTWNGPSSLLGFTAAPALRVTGSAILTLEGFDLNGLGGEAALVVDGSEVRAADLVIDHHDAGFDITTTRGAIRVTSGTLSLDASRLEDNRADNGGALWADASTVTLTSTRLVANEAADGGAIWARNSTVLLDDCQAETNEAEGGGAVRVEGGTLDTVAGSVTGNRGATGGGWGGGGSSNGGAILATGSAQVTLAGTVFDGNEASTTGGAVRLEGASLAIVDGASFTGNSAGWGGAIYIQTTGGVQILGSLFDGNRATTDDGGAVRYRAETNSTLEIVGSLFRGNEATGSGGGLGTSSATGAQAGALWIDDTDFFDNRATDGGGLDIDSVGEVTGKHLRVCGNEATGSGGGAFVEDAGDQGHRWSNSVFTENVAGTGGGLLLQSAGAAEVLNDSFLGNSATTGGGVHVADTPLGVVNTLVAYTTGGDGLAGPASSSVAVTYSAFWSNTAGDLPSALASGTGNVFADPMLTAFTPDGDCTNDEPWPLQGSPLLDAGDPAVTDPDGSRSDIGAYGGPNADWDDLADEDDDGFSGGLDCDDTDPLVNPDAQEVCNGVDDDCNGDIDDEATDAVPFYEDEDDDGYGVGAESVLACEAPEGYAALEGDCDDQLAAVNPGATEICNAIDDDCDSETDEGVLIDWWADADADGFGAEGEPVQACFAPDQHTDVPGDCDDTDPEVHPEAEDPAGDGLDANCDGLDGVASDDPAPDEGLKVRSGCGCASTGASPALLVLLAVGLVARRRHCT